MADVGAPGISGVGIDQNHPPQIDVDLSDTLPRMAYETPLAGLVKTTRALLEGRPRWSAR